MTTPITCDCPCHDGYEPMCNCCARKGETRPVDATSTDSPGPDRDIVPGKVSAEQECFERAYTGAFGLRLPEMSSVFHRLADGNYSYPLVRAAMRLWQSARSQSAPAAQGEAVAIGEVVPVKGGDRFTQKSVWWYAGDVLGLPIGTKLYTAPQPSAPGVVSDAPKKWPGLKDLEYVIERLRETCSFRDEEGDVTDGLESLLNAIKAVQPSAPGEPNAAWVNAVESYAAAARVIALYLKRFCDEKLPYPEMIADASRKAAAEIERLSALPSADDAPRVVAESNFPETNGWVRRRFLADGARFKLSSSKNGAKFDGFPAELSGRWVALVAAENDQHLRAAPPADARDAGSNHGLDTDTHVFFYEQDFYVLSNFSAFRVTFRGTTFDTAEAAYHYQRFTSAQDRRGVLYTESAHDSFRYAQAHKANQRPDWDAIKFDVMREILRAKADQHEYVRRKLLATGDRILVENSWRDDVWGWGPNRDGQNMLGKLWMEIRAELRAKADRAMGDSNG